MTPAEAAKLLTICAAYDNRKPDLDQAQAWHLVMRDVRFVDARDAVVTHYRRSREWIMPADVIKGVDKVRGERIMQHFSHFQPPDGATGEEYRRWYVETRQAVGDGELTAADAPAPLEVTQRDVVGVLEGRGLRTNAIPTNVITSKAELAKQAARLGREKRQAATKPEPEPLLRPDEYSREPDPSA